MTTRCDQLVLGAGLRGLRAALAAPAPGSVVVEAAPQPGGATRTQRTNGFACELGRFAFAREELTAVLDRLPAPPAPIPAATAHGHVFDSRALVEVTVDPTPHSFRSGAEELAQACRRALGGDLRLGRAAQRARPARDGFEVDLAGDPMATIHCRSLTVCLPTDRAAALLDDWDPGLARPSAALKRVPHAFVFLGGLATDCRALIGYGVAPADTVASPVAETIYCSNVFAGRCLGDRFLLRSELADLATDATDDDLIAIAVAELERWTGHRAPFGFTKVHRFAVVQKDAAWAECRARLQGLAASCPGLRFG